MEARKITAKEAIEGMRIWRVIENAYERENLVLDGEPLLFKIWKQQGPGSPSAFDRCVSLNENEKIIDAKRFWIVRSDDLGEILAGDIEEYPENWIGSMNDEGELEFDRVDEGDLQGAVESFLDDWVRWLDFCDASKIPLELRREIFGSHSDLTFKRLDALGEYRTTVNERDFDCIEAAVDFLRKEAPWFDGDDLDFAAIMLATSDRQGFRFETATPEEEKGRLDPIFDRWEGLA